MSYRDYRISMDIRATYDWSEDFYALIMVAMRHADTANAEKLQAAWPEVWGELQERYNTPMGLLVGERSPEGWSRTVEGLCDPQGNPVRGDLSAPASGQPPDQPARRPHGRGNRRLLRVRQRVRAARDTLPALRRAGR